VDQAAVLREADLFITHHGLNSTHEAIWCGVPMLSYPFFWDQPALAARCQELGVALPLSATVRGPLDPAGVAAVLADFLARRTALRSALAAAKTFEENVMARRDEVVERLLRLG
jgi:UDP:flavonoid glycosyltransferase YjiC (YdhE family)